MKNILIRDIFLDLKKYGIFYFLILLHFVGGSVTNMVVILSSLYSFFYFSTRKSIDLYTIFLLLFTNIALGNGADEFSSNVSFISFFNNVVIIGPLAVSVKLFLVFSIPFRLYLLNKNLKINFYFIAWCFIVLFSFLGLIYSYVYGAENKSGLTVGFRISLLFGVFFINFSNIDKIDFYNKLNKIFKFSLIIMSLGIVTGHWVFIMVGFIPFAWINLKSYFFKLLILFNLSKVIFDFQTTITIAAIFFVSIILYLFFKLKLLNRHNIKLAVSALITLPVLITVYVLSLPIDENGYDFSTIQGYIYFKIFGDRKPIWDASLNVIKSHNFFLTPAGSKLDVYFDYVKKWKEWEEGSHNIFLEIGRQVSFFGMIILSIIIIKGLYRISKNLIYKIDYYFIFSILSIYVTFGLSGQSIIYDGVGFIFCLFIVIFSQIKYS
jgi:hypothetical protein